MLSDDLITDQELDAAGASVAGGREYTMRRDRAIADAVLGKVIVGNLALDQFDALVRDAISWRAQGRDARDKLVTLACMPPDGKLVDGIKLLEQLHLTRDWNNALDHASRVVGLELRKYHPHDKNAAAAILALRRP